MTHDQPVIAMKIITCVPVEIYGRIYRTGSVIELDEREALPLLRSGQARPFVNGAALVRPAPTTQN